MIEKSHMTRVAAVLLFLSLASCGGAKNRPLVATPDHVLTTLSASRPLAGKWRVEAVGTGPETTVELTPIPNRAYSRVVRTDANGAVVATGVALRDAELLYVAWIQVTNDDHGVDGTPHGVELGVFKFAPAGWQGSWWPRGDFATGTLGGSKPPAQVVAGDHGDYPGRFQGSQLKESQPTGLTVHRAANDRALALVDSLRQQAGPGLIQDDKLVAALLPHHGTKPAFAGIGVYHVAGDLIEGHVGWMHMVSDLEMVETMKSPAVVESWKPLR